MRLVAASPEYVEALRQIEAAEEDDVVAQALVVARERLRMDAAYVGTLDDRAQTILALVGETDAHELRTGAAIPVQDTYCVRMLSGRIPNLVPDTKADPAALEVPGSRVIGAYLGVPVTLPSGEVHGTLCCVSNRTRPDLGEDELRFMRVLADIVATRIDRTKTSLARLTERFRAAPDAAQS
jgi:GAF domain-containing protein